VNKKEIKVGSLVRGYNGHGVGIVTGTKISYSTTYFVVFWTGLSKTYRGYAAVQLELIP